MDQLTIWGNFLWTPGFLPHLWFNNKISANQIIFLYRRQSIFSIFGNFWRCARCAYHSNDSVLLGSMRFSGHSLSYLGQLAICVTYGRNIDYTRLFSHTWKLEIFQHPRLFHSFSRPPPPFHWGGILTTIFFDYNNLSDK